MVVRFYSSVAPETTLSAGVTNASTSISVGSVTGFPALTPYTLALDYEGAIEELVEVTNAAGTTLTVTRGIDGTSAAAHNAGARVRHVSSARDFSDSRSHENTGNGVHGLAPGDTLVGTQATQTLLNKTLSGGTITGTTGGSPTFTGTWTGDTNGKFRMNNTVDASPTSINHPFQVGLDSGSNIRIDNNEVMAITNGVASNLILNADGGVVTVNGNQTTDTATIGLSMFCGLDTNLLQVGRASATATAAQFKADADTQFRYTMRADGLNAWGGGTSATDVTLARTAPGVLTVSPSLATTGFTTTNAIVNNGLTVTGNASFGANITDAPTGITYKVAQSGTTNISFTNQSVFTVAVTFPSAFPAPPSVFTNINDNGSNNTARWISRAYGITTTGFTFYVAAPTAVNQTWTSVPCTWTAIEV